MTTTATTTAWPAAPVAPRSQPVRRAWRLTAGHVTAVVAVNLGLIALLWVRHGGLQRLADPGGWLTGAGQLAGLYGAFLVLAQLLLMSRTSCLERLLGRDRLVAAHRWVGFGSVSLLAGHAVLITVGYAAGADTGAGAQLWELLTTYPDVLMAAVGLALFLGVAATSVRAARRRLAYETWYFVHLYAYLAVALAFAHQLADGADFVDDVVARAYWIGLYAAVVGCLVAFRVAGPIALWLRHRPRVEAVVPEGPGVVSLYLHGRRFGELAAEPGQFFNVRLLTRTAWYKPHPFSLSAAPDGVRLRFTVKALGDDTASLASVRPGTPVLLEGPYGAMTAAAGRRPKALLVAGGVGITPLRALFERLTGDVVLLYRASRWEDVVLRAELDRLAWQRSTRVVYLVGRRGTAAMPFDPLAPASLHRLVPDAAERDVFVCGPPGMTATTTRSLAAMGVPAEQVHTERFAY